MKKLGIDESGRGSLIGSLIIGYAIINEQNLKDLNKLKVRDAKTTSFEERQNIIQYLKDYKYDFGFLEIPASLINTGANLNLLELTNMLSIITNHRNVDKYEIDAFVPKSGIPKLKSDFFYLSNFCKMPINGDLILENKAESKYMSVALASIVARYYWDLHVKKLRKKIFEDTGISNIGSLYTPDHNTLRFIRDYKNYSEVRTVFKLSGRNWEKILNEIRR